MSVFYDHGTSVSGSRTLLVVCGDVAWVFVPAALSVFCGRCTFFPTAWHVPWFEAMASVRSHEFRWFVVMGFHGPDPRCGRWSVAMGHQSPVARQSRFPVVTAGQRPDERHSLCSVAMANQCLAQRHSRWSLLMGRHVSTPQLFRCSVAMARQCQTARHVGFLWPWHVTVRPHSMLVLCGHGMSCSGPTALSVVCGMARHSPDPRHICDLLPWHVIVWPHLTVGGLRPSNVTAL
jgi:hypothetical protein